jgi:hypothetical protein
LVRARERFNENWVCGNASESASLAQGEYSIHTTLDASRADANPKHRLTEIFHGAPRATLTSAELPHEPRKPRPISDLESFRNHALADPSAGRALPLVENEMGTLHLGFGTLVMLMRMEGLPVSKLLAPACTWLGWHAEDLGRLQKRLPPPLVSLMGTGLALCFRFLSAHSLLGCVR